MTCKFDNARRIGVKKYSCRNLYFGRFLLNLPCFSVAFVLFLISLTSFVGGNSNLNSVKSHASKVFENSVVTVETYESSSKLQQNDLHSSYTIHLLPLKPKTESYQEKRPKEWSDFRMTLDDNISNKTLKNITCSELNTTFTNVPPFDILGLPQCGESIKPKMELFLPHKQIVCRLNPFYLPNKETTLCFEALEEQKDVTKIVLVIHGFLKDFDTPWMHQFQSDIQKVDPLTAVVLIGWDHGLSDIFSYWKAAANTRYIGTAMFQIVKEMQKTVRRKMFVHCAGHSLGAQSCGFAGKYLVADPEVENGFDRVSGMDPAGPLFTNDVPYPFDYLNIKPTARLGPHDGKLVDVIHTDGDARYLGILPQYGTMEQLGTVDFYPGSKGYYGNNQPGCLDFINIISCSHSRARQLFQASITNAVCLATRKCHGDPHMIPKNCVNFTEPTIVSMGYWWESNNKEPGLYLVEEESHFPYCT